MSIIKIESLRKNVAGLLIILLIYSIFMQGVYAASRNDACFAGGCHNSTSLRPIDRMLYDSNPHNIIKCVDCHNPSTVYPELGHGKFIRQLNGSKITGPLTTKYNSQNFSLCYACHNETKLIGILPGWNYRNGEFDHENPPTYISIIGTNFINIRLAGYTDNGYWPANSHWNHLDLYGIYPTGYFDSDMNGVVDSRPSCPTCHNVHGTNYPKMTKNDLAITYGSDSNGTFGKIGSMDFAYSGGDLFCRTCHSSESGQYKYYRNEINLFEDCISCHIYNVDHIENISLVNITAFSHGVHVNVSTAGGSGVVTNNDCWTCHFEKDMNRSNISKCEGCHTGIGKPAAPTAPIITSHLTAKTTYSCVFCHSKVIEEPGTGIINITSHYLKRPLITTPNYCDYCHGPNPGSPFNATIKTIPEFKHDDPAWNGNSTCRTCHANSSVPADINATDTSTFHDMTTELGDAYNGSIKSDCILCHIQKDPQFVSAPDLPTSHPTILGQQTTECDGCHRSGSNTLPQQLHSVEPTGGGCVACHSNNASRYYVNISLFDRHKNLNTSDGDNVTDADCKTCHFGAANITMSLNVGLGKANHSNTYFCEDCHNGTDGIGPVKPNATTDPNLVKTILKHGKTDCKWCHIAGDQLPKPLINENETLRYHPNGPKGTAKGRNCLTCHVNGNLPDSPFHAPGEVHATTSTTSCPTCHASDNHGVKYIPSTFVPVLENLIINSSVESGNFAEVKATLKDNRINKYVQMAAAQYQVKDASGIIVIDWTNMTAKDGRFSSSTEIVNASINTSNLLGSYTVYINGMSSAPKTNIGLAYYPFNGRWSGSQSIQFTVTQQTGNATGVVRGILGNNLSGAIVSTNTTFSTITNSNGLYSLTLPIGTYRLTASKEPEYYPNSSVIVTVNASTTVTQDIILTPKPTGTISGTVRIK